MTLRVEVGRKYMIVDENRKQPQCPSNKEPAITEALKYFKII